MAIEALAHKICSRGRRSRRTRCITAADAAESGGSLRTRCRNITAPFARKCSNSLQCFIEAVDFQLDIGIPNQLPTICRGA